MKHLSIAWLALTSATSSWIFSLKVPSGYKIDPTVKSYVVIILCMVLCLIFFYLNPFNGSFHKNTLRKKRSKETKHTQSHNNWDRKPEPASSTRSSIRDPAKTRPTASYPTNTVKLSHHTDEQKLNSTTLSPPAPLPQAVKRGKKPMVSDNAIKAKNPIPLVEEKVKAEHKNQSTNSPQNQAQNKTDSVFKTESVYLKNNDNRQTHSPAERKQDVQEATAIIQREINQGIALGITAQELRQRINDFLFKRFRQEIGQCQTYDFTLVREVDGKNWFFLSFFSNPSSNAKATEGLLFVSPGITHSAKVAEFFEGGVPSQTISKVLAPARIKLNPDGHPKEATTKGQIETVGRQ